MGYVPVIFMDIITKEEDRFMLMDFTRIFLQWTQLDMERVDLTIEIICLNIQVRLCLIFIIDVFKIIFPNIIWYNLVLKLDWTFTKLIPIYLIIFYLFFFRILCLKHKVIINFIHWNLSFLLFFLIKLVIITLVPNVKFIWSRLL